MRAYTYSVYIDRAPEAVWACLTDLSNQSRWRAGVRLMEVVGGGPLVAGAEVRFVMDVLGKVSDRTVKTTEFEPPRRWVSASSADGLSGEFAYAIEPDGSGTKVTLTGDLHAHRFLVWIFLPAIARQERKWRAGQMERFKRVCESAL